jgi:hypothetical protein
MQADKQASAFAVIDVADDPISTLLSAIGEIVGADFLDTGRQLSRNIMCGVAHDVPH